MADRPNGERAGTAAQSNDVPIPVNGSGGDKTVSSISADGKGPLSRYLAAQPQRGNASDAVTNALREAILDGAIAESTWLREEDLARELSVSRTPVREALRRLADERLTHRVANRGSIVAPMTLDEILAVYAVRESLEGLAARTVAQHRPAGAVEMLYEKHRAMVECAELGKVEQLAVLNLEFHGILRQQAANPYLDLFLTQVEQAVRRFRHSTLDSQERCRKALAEHLSIIEAIAAGDADGAQQAALVHMRNARQARILALTEML